MPPGEGCKRPIYTELKTAFKQQITSSAAEGKTQKVKLCSGMMSLFDFNHRFEAIASCCTCSDDKVKDIYIKCLKVKLRDDLAIRTPETL